MGAALVCELVTDYAHKVEYAFMQPADYFLKLAHTGSAVCRYQSELGNAYLVSGPEAIKTVFRQGAHFACPTHPYLSIHALLHPLGREWLGIESCATHSDALMAGAHAFFENHELFPMENRSNAAGILASADFYIESKAMFFALCCRLLFDLDIGDKSLDIARASDVIENVRSGYDANASGAGNKTSASQYESALSEFSQLAMLLLQRRGGVPSESALHAVQETILSASVPLAYAFIWALLLLGRDKETQQLIRDEATMASPKTLLSLDAIRAHRVIAVVKEALRLYPPVWALSRTSTREQCLAGMAIQSGDSIVVSPYALHRMRSAWDKSHQFDPGRFRAGTPRPQAYMPFGAGARTCPAAKWNPPFLALAVQSFLRRHSLSVNKMPRARPLVALRPALNFSVSLHKLADPLPHE